MLIINIFKIENVHSSKHQNYHSLSLFSLDRLQDDKTTYSCGRVARIAGWVGLKEWDGRLVKIILNLIQLSHTTQR